MLIASMHKEKTNTAFVVLVFETLVLFIATKLHGAADYAAPRLFKSPLSSRRLMDAVDALKYRNTSVMVG